MVRICGRGNWVPFSAEHAEIRRRSVAKKAYEIREIRSRIFDHADKNTLVKCMSLSREGMWEIARRLYCTISYNQAQELVLVPRSRRQIYAGAVKSIEAYAETTVLSKEIEQQLKKPGKRRLKHEEYELEHFREDLLNILIPHLKNEFPSLRFIYFGIPYEPFISNCWVVDVSNPHPYPPNSQTQSHPPRLDHLTINYLFFYYIHIDPKNASFATPYSSFRDFTLETRFDLLLHTESSPGNDGRRSQRPIHPHPPMLSTEWELALREDDRFVGVKSIDTRDIKVSLDSFACICKKQQGKGFRERIAVIRAPNILAWTMDGFREFVSVASTSLTSLNLLGRHELHPCSLKEWDRREFLGFESLPELIRLIQTHLPNLTTLAMRMDSGKGDRSAEALCRDMLTSDILDKRGSLTKLVIEPKREIPLTPFNTLRAVSPLLAPEFEVFINNCGACSTKQAQVDLLKSLRTQSRDRRHYLSTVDFLLLDCWEPEHVAELRYDGDGIPRSRLEKSVKMWAERATSTKITASETLIPNLLASMEAYASQATQTAKMTSEANTSDKLAEAERLLQSVCRVSTAAKDVLKIVQEAEASEKGIREYCRTLLRIDNGKWQEDF